MFEHVGRQIQCARVVARIDPPDHHGGHDFVLSTVAGFKHALDIGDVLGQQLQLERGFAFVGLDGLQAQPVLQQLVK